MKRLAMYLVFASLALALALPACAAQPTDPPGQGECDRGNSTATCRPDPQPDHGADCDEHGPKEGGINEDHCLGGPTPSASASLPPTATPTSAPSSMPTPTATPGASVAPSSGPTQTLSPGPSASSPATPNPTLPPTDTASEAEQATLSIVAFVVAFVVAFAATTVAMSFHSTRRR